MEASSTPRRIPFKFRRLHKPYMYKMVFEGGRALRGLPLTLRYFRVEDDITRIGYIIRKKSGDAPFRNSVRRTLRRSFQEALSGFAEGTWLVFDVSDKASTASRAKLRGEARRLLLEAGTAAAAMPARSLAAPAESAPENGDAGLPGRAETGAPRRAPRARPTRRVKGP